MIELDCIIIDMIEVRVCLFTGLREIFSRWRTRHCHSAESRVTSHDCLIKVNSNWTRVPYALRLGAVRTEDLYSTYIFHIPYFSITMTSKTLSPTARLLRTSRLFSLPPPLPRPGAKLAASKLESDTATLPYPTHAAIETSPSSLNVGDWGLKRSLPRRFTASSTTPMIRIGDIDSIDHIVEFESAADYTITLRKWQEMNIPISVPLPSRVGIDGGRSLAPSVSVFEARLDNTEKGNGEKNHTRWKFKGPWLVRKSEGEFQQYVQKNVRRRKFAFRNFLRSELQVKIEEDRKREAMDSGQDSKQGLGVSEEDLDAYIRELRHDRKTLHRLIERFLDLPNYNESSKQMSGSASTKEQVFIEEGPLQTHPAAGLSYLRTASHIHNHPIFGPQQVEPPVQGRILRPQYVARSKPKRALVGIAGVVADDDRGPLVIKVAPRGLAEFDPDIPGGTKEWYHPEHASVDSRGRLNLILKRTDPHTLAIYQDIKPPQEDETVDTSIMSGGNRQFPSSSSSPSAVLRETSRQGYGLEGTGLKSRSGTATPTAKVDDEEIFRGLRSLGIGNRKATADIDM